MCCFECLASTELSIWKNAECCLKYCFLESAPRLNAGLIKSRKALKGVGFTFFK